MTLTAKQLVAAHALLLLACAGVAHIPKPDEGKTYLGCCPMCEATIDSDGRLRLATAPLTQKPVDEATAVLARD